MNSQERQKAILEKLKEPPGAIFKGTELAEAFGVTRQVIVKDIALLRAAGHPVASTPRGYGFVRNQSGTVSQVIVCWHQTYEEMRKELSLIVQGAGRVLDIIVFHDVYGEIVCRLNLYSLRDVEEFMASIQSAASKPLSSITEGLHMHTVECPDQAHLDAILDDLEQHGFLRDPKNA